MSSLQRIRFADSGQAWTLWDPRRAFEDDRLARAVGEFDPVPNPAGRAAARWLREDALAYDGFAVTYLALVNLKVHGFYAMCAGEVEVPEDQRRDLRLPNRRLPVAHLVWLARRVDGDLSGLELLAHAERRAELAAQVQGLAGLAVDPFDADTDAMWQAPPFDFMSTETNSQFMPTSSKSEAGSKRLWKPLPRLEKARPTDDLAERRRLR
jgi:hypothetical protein